MFFLLKKKTQCIAGCSFKSNKELEPAGIRINPLYCCCWEQKTLIAVGRREEKVLGRLKLMDSHSVRLMWSVRRRTIGRKGCWLHFPRNQTDPSGVFRRQKDCTGIARSCGKKGC
jgi:hypothetical protein